MDAYIVNILKVNNNGKSEKVIRMIGESFDRAGNRVYSKRQATEAQVVQEIKANKYKLANAEVSNGKLKGTTGSLERFDGETYVILSQIVDETDKVLGYRLANTEGAVAKKPLRQVLQLCKKVDSAGGVPIQNAQYVAGSKDNKSAHIKAYPGYTFPKEVHKRNKNEHVHTPKKMDPAVAQKVETAVKSQEKEKLTDIFNNEQIEELKAGKKAGVNIKRFGNPALSAEQMRELRGMEELGFDCSVFADPAYEVQSLKYYKTEMKYGSGEDVYKFANPKYSPRQIGIISLAYDSGLDISKLSNPELTANEMEQIRVRLDSALWKNENVVSDSGWFEMN